MGNAMSSEVTKSYEKGTIAAIARLPMMTHFSPFNMVRGWMGLMRLINPMTTGIWNISTKIRMTFVTKFK